MKETWLPGKLTTLERDECLELLAIPAIGRVAWCEPTGPAVIPVNYVLEQECIVFRTSPETALARQIDLGFASFEVDHYDDYTQSGWSVLVRGRVNHVDDAEAMQSPEGPQPWVSGARTFNVRITPLTITGRRIIPT